MQTTHEDSFKETVISALFNDVRFLSGNAHQVYVEEFGVSHVPKRDTGEFADFVRHVFEQVVFAHSCFSYTL